MSLSSFTIFTEIKVFTNGAFVSGSHNRVHFTSITDDVFMDMSIFFSSYFIFCWLFFRILVFLNNFRSHVFNLLSNHLSHSFFELFHLLFALFLPIEFLIFKWWRCLVHLMMRWRWWRHLVISMLHWILWWILRHVLRITSRHLNLRLSWLDIDT